MRKFLFFAVYTLLLLLIGRNLTGLPRINPFSDLKKDTVKLSESIKKTIASRQGSYSVYFSDLTKNNYFGINEKQIHTAASINKVPIVASLYHLASRGKINLDEQITIQEKDIQDYGTGSIRYKGPGGTYSLRTLAKLALQESDNTAAFVLSTKLGEAEIQKLATSWGMTQTNIARNKTSVFDMYILFRKIYKGEIVSNTLTQELLNFMTTTDIENRIPDLLPKEATVYHKTGDAVGSMHDAGIIKKGERLYFLGILASDIGNTETETRKTIAEISKEVYYFQTE